MAKKKIRKLQTARGAQTKSRVRRRRRNPDDDSAPRSNPSGFMADLTELGELVIPAFAGYAGGRLVSRITYVQAQKKWPRAAPHLAAGASALTVLAAYLALPRVRKFASYQVPATLGAAIASLQSLVQTYLPKFGWMVSDYTQLASAKSAPAPRAQTLSQEDLDMLDAGMDLNDEGELDVDPKGASFDPAAMDATGAVDDGDFDDLDMN
jgi:hypothetical protein